MDLSLIPPERLALLDTTTLYRGPHNPPSCKHCARELAYEVVTGIHLDLTPPGCTNIFDILPHLNDGPWLSDKHRTVILRPYIHKLLILDSANDKQRTEAVLDYICSAVPNIRNAINLYKFGDTADVFDICFVLSGILDEFEMLYGNEITSPTYNQAAKDIRNTIDSSSYLTVNISVWENTCREILNIICTIP